MTETAQNAFQAFQERQSSADYIWPDTVEAQDAEMREYTALKIASMKEARVNQDEIEANQAIHQAQWNADLKSEMISKGYSGNGTVEDFIRLFTRPSINSTDSEALAVSFFEGGDSFEQHYLVHRDEA
jgi:hypothetical protein